MEDDPPDKIERAEPSWADEASIYASSPPLRASMAYGDEMLPVPGGGESDNTNREGRDAMSQACGEEIMPPLGKEASEWALVAGGDVISPTSEEEGSLPHEGVFSFQSHGSMSATFVDEENAHELSVILGDEEMHSYPSRNTMGANRWDEEDAFEPFPDLNLEDFEAMDAHPGLSPPKEHSSDGDYIADCDDEAPMHTFFENADLNKFTPPVARQKRNPKHEKILATIHPAFRDDENIDILLNDPLELARAKRMEPQAFAYTELDREEKAKSCKEEWAQRVGKDKGKAGLSKLELQVLEPYENSPWEFPDDALEPVTQAELTALMLQGVELPDLAPNPDIGLFHLIQEEARWPGPWRYPTKYTSAMEDAAREELVAKWKKAEKRKNEKAARDEAAKEKAGKELQEHMLKIERDNSFWDGANAGDRAGVIVEGSSVYAEAMTQMNWFTEPAVGGSSEYFPGQGGEDVRLSPVPLFGDASVGEDSEPFPAYEDYGDTPIHPSTSWRPADVYDSFKSTSTFDNDAAQRVALEPGSEYDPFTTRTLAGASSGWLNMDINPLQKIDPSVFVEDVEAKAASVPHTREARINLQETLETSDPAYDAEDKAADVAVGFKELETYDRDDDDCATVSFPSSPTSSINPLKLVKTRDPADPCTPISPRWVMLPDSSSDIDDVDDVPETPSRSKTSYTYFTGSPSKKAEDAPPEKTDSDTRPELDTQLNREERGLRLVVSEDADCASSTKASKSNDDWGTKPQLSVLDLFSDVNSRGLEHIPVANDLDKPCPSLTRTLWEEQDTLCAQQPDPLAYMSETLVFGEAGYCSEILPKLPESPDVLDETLDEQEALLSRHRMDQRIGLRPQDAPQTLELPGDDDLENVTKKVPCVLPEPEEPKTIEEGLRPPDDMVPKYDTRMNAVAGFYQSLTGKRSAKSGTPGVRGGREMITTEEMYELEENELEDEDEDEESSDDELTDEEDEDGGSKKSGADEEGDAADVSDDEIETFSTSAASVLMESSPELTDDYFSYVPHPDNAQRSPMEEEKTRNSLTRTSKAIEFRSLPGVSSLMEAPNDTEPFPSTDAWAFMEEKTLSPETYWEEYRENCAAMSADRCEEEKTPLPEEFLEEYRLSCGEASQDEDQGESQDQESKEDHRDLSEEFCDPDDQANSHEGSPEKSFEQSFWYEPIMRQSLESEASTYARVSTKALMDRYFSAAPESEAPTVPETSSAAVNRKLMATRAEALAKLEGRDLIPDPAPMPTLDEPLPEIIQELLEIRETRLSQPAPDPDVDEAGVSMWEDENDPEFLRPHPIREDFFSIVTPAMARALVVWIIEKNLDTDFMEAFAEAVDEDFAEYCDRGLDEDDPVELTDEEAMALIEYLFDPESQDAMEEAERESEDAEQERLSSESSTDSTSGRSLSTIQEDYDGPPRDKHGICKVLLKPSGVHAFVHHLRRRGHSFGENREVMAYMELPDDVPPKEFTFTKREYKLYRELEDQQVLGGTEHLVVDEKEEPGFALELTRASDPEFTQSDSEDLALLEEEAKKPHQLEVEGDAEAMDEGRYMWTTDLQTKSPSHPLLTTELDSDGNDADSDAADVDDADSDEALVVPDVASLDEKAGVFPPQHESEELSTREIGPEKVSLDAVAERPAFIESCGGPSLFGLGISLSGEALRTSSQHQRNVSASGSVRTSDTHELGWDQLTVDDESSTPSVVTVTPRATQAYLKVPTAPMNLRTPIPFGSATEKLIPPGTFEITMRKDALISYRSPSPFVGTPQVPNQAHAKYLKPRTLISAERLRPGSPSLVGYRERPISISKGRRPSMADTVRASSPAALSVVVADNSSAMQRGESSPPVPDTALGDPNLPPLPRTLAEILAQEEQQAEQELKEARENRIQGILASVEGLVEQTRATAYKDATEAHARAREEARKQGRNLTKNYLANSKSILEWPGLSHNPADGFDTEVVFKAEVKAAVERESLEVDEIKYLVELVEERIGVKKLKEHEAKIEQCYHPQEHREKLQLLGEHAEYEGALLSIDAWRAVYIERKDPDFFTELDGISDLKQHIGDEIRSAQAEPHIAAKAAELLTEEIVESGDQTSEGGSVDIEESSGPSEVPVSRISKTKIRLTELRESIVPSVDTGDTAALKIILDAAIAESPKHLSNNGIPTEDYAGSEQRTSTSSKFIPVSSTSETKRRLADFRGSIASSATNDDAAALKFILDAANLQSQKRPSDDGSLAKDSASDEQRAGTSFISVSGALQTERLLTELREEIAASPTDDQTATLTSIIEAAHVEFRKRLWENGMPPEEVAAREQNSGSKRSVSGTLKTQTRLTKLKKSLATTAADDDKAAPEILLEAANVDSQKRLSDEGVSTADFAASEQSAASKRIPGAKRIPSAAFTQKSQAEKPKSRWSFGLRRKSKDTRRISKATFSPPLSALPSSDHGAANIELQRLPLRNEGFAEAPGVREPTASPKLILGAEMIRPASKVAGSEQEKSKSKWSFTSRRPSKDNQRTSSRAVLSPSIASMPLSKLETTKPAPDSRLSNDGASVKTSTVDERSAGPRCIPGSERILATSTAPSIEPEEPKSAWKLSLRRKSKHTSKDTRRITDAYFSSSPPPSMQPPDRSESEALSMLRLASTQYKRRSSGKD